VSSVSNYKKAATVGQR